MVPKFANVYTFKHKTTGVPFTARWDVKDGAQKWYTGPNEEYEFVSVELNVPDGERTEEEDFELGEGVAEIPDWAKANG